MARGQLLALLQMAWVAAALSFHAPVPLRRTAATGASLRRALGSRPGERVRGGQHAALRAWASQSFRTEVFVQPMPTQIELEDRLLLMGSCFSENIGARLQRLKFAVDVNPFGICYNPLSLAWSLERLLKETPFTPQDVVCSRGRYFSYNFHSSFTSGDGETTLAAMNAAHQRGRRALSEAKVLFLTLGSAFAWRHSDGTLVANCHKQPGSLFTKVLVSPTEIEDALLAAIQRCRDFNPQLKVVLTVSPVRHWREGAMENARSKAALIVAAQALRERSPHFQYFPSYEIMMDDLRDYRFYASDMLHPSADAVHYIWLKLQAACFAPSCLDAFERLDALERAVRHKPFDATSREYQTFCLRHLQQISSLEADFPHMDLASERAHFQSSLAGRIDQAAFGDRRLG